MEFSLPLTELLSPLWMMMVNNEAVDTPCMVRSVGFEQWLQDYLVCVLCILDLWPIQGNVVSCVTLWLVLSLRQFVGWNL